MRSCRPIGGALLAAGLLAHSLPGWAFGLGKPARQPVIGSSLRIEIPLILGQGELPPDKECLRIAPIAGSQGKEFFPRDAQLFIEMQGTPRILVVSQRPVAEPIIEFTLIVGCNEQFTREVMLLADPPQSPTLPQTPTLPRTSKQPVAETALLAPIDARPMRAPLLRPRVEATVAGGLDNLTLPTDTTLNALARKRYPTQRAARDEYRRQMIAANPGFFVDAQLPGAVMLPKGTLLNVPDSLPPVETPPPSGSSGQASAPGTPRASPKAKDRLVIGGGGGAVNERKFVASGEALAAIERLELMMAEQRLIESRIEESLLVMNQSLLDARRRFSELQTVQQRDAKEKEELRSRLDKVDANLKGAIGFWQFLILILTSGAIGAGLLLLHARLTNGRRMLPEPIVTPPAEPPAANSPTPAPAAPPTAPPAAPPTPTFKQIVPGIAARGMQAPRAAAPAMLRRDPTTNPGSGGGAPATVPSGPASPSTVPTAPAAKPKAMPSPAAPAPDTPEIPQASTSPAPVLDPRPPTVDQPATDPRRLPWETKKEGPASTARSMAAPAPEPGPASATKSPVKHSAGNAKALSAKPPTVPADDSSRTTVEMPAIDFGRLPREKRNDAPTATAQSVAAPATAAEPARATKNPDKASAGSTEATSASSPAVPADDSHQIDFELPAIDFGRLPREKKQTATTAAPAMAEPVPAPEPANAAKDPARSPPASTRSATSPTASAPAPDAPLPDIHFAMSEMSPFEVAQMFLDNTGKDAKAAGRVTDTVAPATRAAEAAPDVEHLSLITPSVMLNPELAAEELRHTPHAAKLFSGQATIAVAQSIGLTGELATQINRLLPRLPSFDIDAWFSAFDTLRTAGERRAFASLTHLLSENLNVEPPFWEAHRQAVKSSILDYPYVMRRLQAVWQADDPELARALLLELLADSRNGTRAGFSEGSAKDIYLLIRVLDELSSNG